MSYWTIIIIVLLMFGLERIVVTKTTRNEAGRNIYRRFWLLSPNGLSVMRLPMGFLSILMASQGWWILATLWFSFWMITDMTDGTIARNCDMVTETGKWLDPLSDKFMYFPALLYFSLGHVCDFGLTILPFWLVMTFVVLDTLGQCSRFWVAKTAANSFGKAKTALVTVLLSLLSLNHIDTVSLGDFVILNPRFVFFLMLFCTVLAFMSFYCKVIPDIWYANTLILLNYLCGIASVILCAMAFNKHIHIYYVFSFSLVFLGQFFDLFDGRLAQKFGSTPNADVFDEIADATNYGVGIVALLFCSLAFCEELIPWQVAVVIGALYWGATMFNLFRYRHSSYEPQLGLFCGMPVSAGAGLAGSAVLVGLEYSHPFIGIFSASVVVAACILMISKLPYKHFGLTMWPAMPRMMKLLLCILVLIFVCLTMSHRNLRFMFVWFSFTASVLYAVFGVDWKQLRKSEKA